MAVVLCGVAVLGAVGALVTWLSAGPAEGGFWGGVVVGLTFVTLSIAYLCWGGLQEWRDGRRRN